MSYRLRGRKVPKGTPGAKKHRRRARKYYGQNIPGQPPERRFPLASNKEVAQKMLADLVARGERGGAGMADLTHAARPIAEHVADFEAHLRADGTSAQQIALKCGRLRRLIAGCGFGLIGDVAALKVKEYLQSLRQPGGALPPLDPEKGVFTLAEAAAALGIMRASVAPLVTRHKLAAVGRGKARRLPRATVESLRARAERGAGAQTANYYLREIKSFCRWLADEDRVLKNPLAKVKPGNTALDRRHDRRNLTPDELTRLLAATAASPRSYRGLAGLDRHALYMTACGTGFRADELAALTPALFALDASPPTVALPARKGKNRKPTVQPMPPAVVEALRPYLAGRPPAEPVWPGAWAERGAAMLRLDLEVAGIPYVVDGPDGPLYADFHGLRHTFISMLERAGVSIKQAQTLARHSDPKLTIGRYSHATMADLAEAVGRVPIGAAAEPGLPPETLAALAGLGLILWATLLGGPKPRANGGANEVENAA